MTGVMMAPPATKLAKTGTKVPWRYASLKEFQLMVVSPQQGGSSSPNPRGSCNHYTIMLIAERSMHRKVFPNSPLILIMGHSLWDVTTSSREPI
jgi:hypothetical protein